jgi:Fic family protein
MLYGMALGKLKTTLLKHEFIYIISSNNKRKSVWYSDTSGTQLKNPVTDTVVYTPPEGEKVIRDKLKNLEDFIHAEDDLDPLVKMAIIHYQFEAPFL